MHPPRNGAATYTMGGGLYVRGSMDLLDGLVRWLAGSDVLAFRVWSLGKP